MVLDASQIKAWISLFSELCILQELPASVAIEFIIKKQNEINTYISDLRVLGVFEPKNHSTDFLSTLPICSAALREIPVFAGYENSMNLEVATQIHSKCMLKELCNYQNVIFGVQYEDYFQISSEKPKKLAPLVSNVLLDKCLFYDNAIQSIDHQCLSLLLAEDNTFYPGMFVKCRENDSMQKIYNNQTAVFITFYFEQPWLFSSLIKQVYNAFKTQPSPGYAKPSPPCERRVFTTYTTTNANEDIRFLAKSLFIILLDIKTQKIIKVNPTVKYLCEQCEQGTCVHHLNRTTCVCYLCFNWTANYSQTIFNLQGTTISSERLFLLENYVFKNNLLRTLYILLSRCGDPKQIVTDINFVKHCLRVIYNTKTVDRISEFMDKNSIKILPNCRLEDL